MPNARITTSSSLSSSRRAARRWIGRTLVLAMLGAAAGIAIGQYRVNNQIYGNTSSSVRYGRSYQANYARQPTYNLLPSENRNLVYRSGALPSTLRMNHHAVGPMAPQGVRAYVPEPSSFRSSGVAQGNYVNTMTSTRITTAAITNAPMRTTPAMQPNPAAVGSMRYSAPAPGAVPMGGGPMSAAVSPSATAAPSLWQDTPKSAVRATPQSGSIKYSWNLAG